MFLKYKCQRPVYENPEWAICICRGIIYHAKEGLTHRFLICGSRSLVFLRIIRYNTSDIGLKGDWHYGLQHCGKHGESLY